MSTNQFNPDYAVHPGWVLEEQLEADALSVAEFARRCGRSQELIRGIISGETPLDPDTARLFERELEVSVNIWLGLEENYRNKLARDAQTKAAREEKGRLYRFLARILFRFDESQNRNLGRIPRKVNPAAKHMRHNGSQMNSRY